MKTNLIKRPIITEKSLQLAQQHNAYTFEVSQAASKHQVKIAIAQLYAVDVESVNTLTRPGRVTTTGRRRLRRRHGSTKRALVTLKQGQTIEVFDFERS
ncbi:MAG: 50S ribosomal protein L23 [Candidatus Pacebacteria bacterium CG10_big_fil_rev_8_21_14_0_10_56_10]|nr:MAG: 50S ribosomal protein L23 [Candidatus Pacebacteria bacterium CG10_big_fil_rev_8_21_14_0_10_56_10]